MKFACKTDIGRVRRSNQDSYAVGELPGGGGRLDEGDAVEDAFDADPDDLWD